MTSGSYQAPVSLPSVSPQTLPHTQAGWQQHITYLQQLAGQISAGSWTAPTLKNSWANYTGSTYNPAGFRADLTGRVWLRGLLQAASQSLPSTLWTLPWAPQYTQVLTGLAYTGSAYEAARVDVDTSGNVILTAIASGSIGTGWLSVDGLSFSISP